MTIRNKYTIAEGIKRLAGKGAKPTLLLAEVLGVNKSTGVVRLSCEALGIQDMEVDYYAAVIGGSKFTLWPTVGSAVVIGNIEGSDQYYIVSVIAPEVVELRGADYTMLKGNEVKLELEKLKAALEQIKTAIQNAPVAPGDGGASFKAGILAALSVFDTGNFSQIINDKVKHG